MNNKITTNYAELEKQAASLIEGVPHVISNLGNISALIFNNINKLNWAGFYIFENEKLVLGPFQGKPACIEIGIGKGVCGTAVALNQTMVVNNVHEFPGHIACDSDSKSEIVIPIHHKDKVFGVLDIDSPIYDRFEAQDEDGLQRIAKIVEESINKCLVD